MALLLVFLFIVVPIVELYVIIQIGQAIGVLPTIALLILDSVLGAALMRSQGRAVWRRFNGAIAEGRVPGREVMDGALVIFGGALLLTPGFLSDILGLILLLPPTRAVVRAVLLRRFAGRVVAGAATGAQARMGRMFTFEAGGPGAGRRRPAAPSDDDDVVEGTASEVPPQRRELP
ncbi:MAG: FxsA family protein [Solirubrobacteraceae bacterium]|nr:FxsA family protein [Solirubrobacteraceae bacterium]